MSGSGNSSTTTGPSLRLRTASRSQSRFGRRVGSCALILYTRIDLLRLQGAAGESAWANSFVEVLGKVMDTTVINELTRSVAVGSSLGLIHADVSSDVDVGRRRDLQSKPGREPWYALLSLTAERSLPRQAA